MIKSSDVEQLQIFPPNTQDGGGRISGGEIFCIIRVFGIKNLKVEADYKFAIPKIILIISLNFHW